MDLDFSVYSVSGLTKEIKTILESSLPFVWVEGEVSNFVHHSSGHMYFSLKDSDAQISCVVWRSRAAGLLFAPQSGMKVTVFGSVRVFERRGSYQIDVQKIHPAGIGELQIAFEQLKERLRQEGMFDEEHKKPIPVFPRKIGIVTSPTGAAIRDIFHVLQRRFPGVEIILRPATVQGEDAARDIADAIKDFNDFGEVDVLIVGRGGGSLEDLWAFNEEVVARAIYSSNIPVISAVGHEVDYTIADFVADKRAPTPSAAAEIAVPDRKQIREVLRLLLFSCFSSINTILFSFREQLRIKLTSYGFRRPADAIAQYRQRLDDLLLDMQKTLDHRMEILRTSLQQIKKHLQGMHPDSILKRGYAVVTKGPDKRIVRSVDHVELEEDVNVRLADGHLDVQVKQKRK
ncbi:exodeoxyribonuclease VII large subunit [candidate division KSB1 bacterium]|nr:exodeoxyribonuclease VII large subunit [candidate division KSB1 bacterium]